VSFFASRWVEAPPDARESTGLPLGFRAAGVPCGIKPSGGPDLGLIVSGEPGTTSAARFTRSGVLAAPVLVCQERCRLDALRAVVVNSGNANAATGGRGLDEAARMQGAAAMVAGSRGPGRGGLDRGDRRPARRPEGGAGTGERARGLSP
jgi:glutamate N-acetyltransferase/amino-acid N-acetyltransferase